MRYGKDFCEEDLETPRKRKIFWKTFQQTLISKDNKIKMLQQSNRRLTVKIDNLNNIIEDLQNQNKINASGSYMLKVNNFPLLMS